MDALAITYAGTVKRQVGVEDKARKDKIAELFFQSLNNTMSSVNKFLVGERTLIIQPYFSPKYQRINYNFYHQYQFDLVFDYSTPDKELIAVITSDYKDDFEKTNWTIYTKNSKYIFTGSKLQSQDEHNSDFLPFVVLYDHKPDIDCDYLDPNYSFVDGNLQMNLALSDMLNLLQKQAHGILTLTLADDMASPGDASTGAGSTNGGVGAVQNQSWQTDPRGQLKTGYDDIVVLSKNAAGDASEMGYVEQKANFDQAVNVIKMFLSLYASNARIAF